MRFLAGVAIILGLAQLSGEGVAADRLTCLKTTCQAAGSACASVAYDANESCQKAIKQTCGKVPPAQMMACVKDAGKSCAATREAAEAACHDQLAACAASCGPNGADAHEYWCTGEIGGGLKSGFCAGENGKGGIELIKRCRAQVFPKETSDFTQDCQPI